MRNFLVNVTGQGTGVCNTQSLYEEFVPKNDGTCQAWSAVTANSTNRIRSGANVQIYPAGITVAANLNSNDVLNASRVFSPLAATQNGGGGIFVRGNLVEILGGGIVDPVSLNRADAFVVTLSPSSTANTQPPVDSLTKVITYSTPGSSGSNTWGGYLEWDVRQASAVNVAGNAVTYIWTISGNTGVPWRFPGAPNGRSTATANTTGGVEVIFCY